MTSLEAMEGFKLRLKGMPCLCADVMPKAGSTYMLNPET